MSLIRYDPFRELRTLTRGFNSLNELFDAQQFPELNLSAFAPHINTREGKFAYHIDVDLPGVNKDNVDIHIEEGVLHIFGERKTKEETKQEDYYKIESSFGRFERRFTLPAGVDSENIHAECADGVLEITVPKLTKKTEQMKKIEIS